MATVLLCRFVVLVAASGRRIISYYHHPAGADFSNYQHRCRLREVLGSRFRPPPIPRALLLTINLPNATLGMLCIFLRLVINRLCAVFRIDRRPAGLHLIEVEIDAIAQQHADSAPVFVASDADEVDCSADGGTLAQMIAA